MNWCSLYGHTTARLLLHKTKHMHLYVPYKSFKIYQFQSTNIVCPHLPKNETKQKLKKCKKQSKSKKVIKLFTLELYPYLNSIKNHIWSHCILIISATDKCSLGSISSPLILYYSQKQKRTETSLYCSHFKSLYE